MFTRRQTLRSGYTLVELIVASASSMLLLAGMGASIFIASKAFDESDSQAFTSVAAGNIADEIMMEMQYATRFHERTPHAVTFSIPDRDGDGSEEKLRYAWSGTAGDPLTKELNGSAAAILFDDIQNLDFTFMTRTLIAPPPVVVGVVFEEFTEEKLEIDGTSVEVPKPGGTIAGDLLIAAVATKGNTKSSLSPSPLDGWTEIDIDEEGNVVTFGVWWKIASASEDVSYVFSWSSESTAYGWVMRFSNHDPTNPINDWAQDNGSDISPSSPDVTTTVDDALILRLGGFENANIIDDDPGLAGHVPITMDSSLVDVSGGGGYRSPSSPGNSGTSNFNLTTSSAYITVTIAIAPAP